MGDIWYRIYDDDDDDDDTIAPTPSTKKEQTFREMTKEKQNSIIEEMARGGAICLLKGDVDQISRLTFDYDCDFKTPVIYFPHLDMAERFLNLCDSECQFDIPRSCLNHGVVLVYRGYGSYLTYPPEIFDFMRQAVQQEDQNQRRREWAKIIATRARKNSNITINRTGRTTVLTRYRWVKGYGHKAEKFRADCAEVDVCDEDVGIAVAYAKAMGYDIPDYV